MLAAFIKVEKKGEKRAALRNAFKITQNNMYVHTDVIYFN